MATKTKAELKDSIAKNKLRKVVLTDMVDTMIVADDISNGEYIPDVVYQSNVDTVTVETAFYSKNGDTVTVFGSLRVKTTAVSSFIVSLGLPVGSYSPSGVTGVATSQEGASGGIVFASGPGAGVSALPDSTSDKKYYYSYSYRDNS